MLTRLVNAVRSGTSAAVAAWKSSLLADRASGYGFGGGGGGFGVPNEKTAMGVAGFFAAVRFISEVSAALPIVVEEREAGTDRWTPKHGDRLEYLTNLEPNVDQIGFSFHQLRYIHQLTYAQTYSVIRWDANTGTPLALWPVHPQSMTWKNVPGRGRLYTGSFDTGTEEFDRSQVLHSIGMTLDGVTPLSPLTLFASQIALSEGIRRNAANYNANVPRPGLLVEAQGKLNDEQFATLQSRINTNYNNTRAGTALLLEGGLKATPYHLPFNEMQVLEFLSANEDDIETRIFNMPSKDLKGHERNDYLARYTLFPFLTRDDQELTRKLVPTFDKGRLRLRHQLELIDELDLRTRYESYRVAIMCGMIAVDEARGWENLPPVPDGEGAKPRFPQSVYGKPGTTPTVNPIPAKRSLPETVDPVFQSLLCDTLGSLFSRAEHQLGDITRKPAEFRAGIERLYGKQRALVNERLRAMPDERRRLVLDVIGQHEAALLALDGAPDLAQRATAHADTWGTDARALSLTLLESMSC